MKDENLSGSGLEFPSGGNGGAAPNAAIPCLFGYCFGVCSDGCIMGCNTGCAVGTCLACNVPCATYCDNSTANQVCKGINQTNCSGRANSG
jgi:hypothetical protein